MSVLFLDHHFCLLAIRTFDFLFEQIKIPRWWWFLLRTCINKPSCIKLTFLLSRNSLDTKQKHCILWRRLCLWLCLSNWTISRTLSILSGKWYFFHWFESSQLWWIMLRFVVTWNALVLVCYLMRSLWWKKIIMFVCGYLFVSTLTSLSPNPHRRYKTLEVPTCEREAHL